MESAAPAQSNVESMRTPASRRRFQCRREIAPIRVADREMVKPSRLRGGRLTAPAAPSVEAQMMVVVAEGEESSPLMRVLQRHSDKVTVEADRSLQVRDLQVNMADLGDGFAVTLHRPEAYKRYAKRGSA